MFYQSPEITYFDFSILRRCKALKVQNVNGSGLSHLGWPAERGSDQTAAFGPSQEVPDQTEPRSGLFIV